MKVVIKESITRKSKTYDHGVTNICGRAYADGFEVGTVWLDVRGNYYLDQNVKSARLHGKFPRLMTAKSTRELAKMVHMQFIR